MALYADVNGKQFPVTRGQDIGRYQVRGAKMPRFPGGGSEGLGVSTVGTGHTGAWICWADTEGWKVGTRGLGALHTWVP